MADRAHTQTSKQLQSIARNYAENLKKTHTQTHTIVLYYLYCMTTKLTVQMKQKRIPVLMVVVFFHVFFLLENLKCSEIEKCTNSSEYFDCFLFYKEKSCR